MTSVSFEQLGIGFFFIILQIANDRLIPPDKKNDPLPFCINKENVSKLQNYGTGESNMRMASRGESLSDSKKVMNLYGNQDNSARQIRPGVERDYGRETTFQTSEQTYRTNRKPLFSNGGKLF